MVTLYLDGPPCQITILWITLFLVWITTPGPLTRTPLTRIRDPKGSEPLVEQLSNLRRAPGVASHASRHRGVLPLVGVRLRLVARRLVHDGLGELVQVTGLA